MKKYEIRFKCPDSLGGDKELIYFECQNRFIDIKSRIDKVKFDQLYEIFLTRVSIEVERVYATRYDCMPMQV